MNQRTNSKTKKRNPERDYLVYEQNERERLTDKYVDGSYTWAGGFD